MLLNQPWNDLKQAMEAGLLRKQRPAQDEVLTTTFAIDAEADFLDWMDAHPVDGNDDARTVLGKMDEGLWKGRSCTWMQWASSRPMGSLGRSCVSLP